MTWACAFGSPPDWGAQTTGRGVAVGPVAEAVADAVGDGRAALGDGTADGVGTGDAVAVGGGAGCGEQAPTTTIAIATTRASNRRSRPNT